MAKSESHPKYSPCDDALVDHRFIDSFVICHHDIGVAGDQGIAAAAAEDTEGIVAGQKLPGSGGYGFVLVAAVRF